MAQLPLTPVQSKVGSPMAELGANGESEFGLGWKYGVSVCSCDA